jgi:Na+-driven multidrug efflux pump
MVSLSEIAVLSFVNRFGSTALAAYGAVNQVASYVQFPAVSIGIAASIFGAQSIGAGRIGAHRTDRPLRRRAQLRDRGGADLRGVPFSTA